MREDIAQYMHVSVLHLLLAGCLAAHGALLGCANLRPHAVTVGEVQAPVQWGAAKNVRRLRHLWIADQPDAAGFETAKRAGVKVVIDLREPGEREWDEAAAVRSLGLEYYNVPVARKAPFSRDAFGEIEGLLQAHHGEQILVHCSSGNRAAGWLSTHLVDAHHMSLDSALEVGKRAGITTDAIVEKVVIYVGSTAPNGVK